MHGVVYVLNKKGKPLMPTKRYGHVRRLIKQGLAVPANNHPFTIRLKYETDDVVQSLVCGIDVGRENIGIAVSSENGECLFQANMKTHNKSVTKKMQERAEHRRSRRRHRRQRRQRRAMALGSMLQSGKDAILRNRKSCKAVSVCYPGMEESVTHKVIRGKEARFNNRRRKTGWLTPSARHLVQMHTHLVTLVASFLPINRIVLEHNIFDFQKLEDANIHSWQYQRGPLYGFTDYMDYISKQQNGCCLLCGNGIEHYHHIIPRSKGGSDTPANIVGLCESCHRLVHTDTSSEQRLLSAKAGIRKKYKVGLLNSCIHVIIEELNKRHSLTCCTGYDTAQTRQRLGLEKDHCIDAYSISLFRLNILMPIVSVEKYEMERFKKKSNGIIHKLNSRQYFYNGKLVAVNRHKAMEQKTASLEEYLNQYAETHTQKEVLRHMHQLEVRPAKRIYTFHKRGTVVLFHCGDKVKYYKQNKTDSKVKSFVFVVTGVKVSQDTLEHGTKAAKMKFCTAIEQKSIAFT